jgi:hypothetical protein
MSEMEGSSSNNITKKCNDRAGATDNTVSFIGPLPFTSSNISISNHHSNNDSLSSITIILFNLNHFISSNYCYRLYFDFDKAIDELHYYVHYQNFMINISFQLLEICIVNTIIFFPRALFVKMN